MTFTALLLAGGRSRRMGFDKATLTVAGEPFWQRQLRVLRELSPVVLLISARARPSWCPMEIEVVSDESSVHAPLSGLAAGLRHLQTSHLLVLAIDLPRISAEHLRTLRDVARPGIGVIPLNEGCFEPLCAIYPVEAAATAQAALESGDISLQHFGRTLLSKSLIQSYALTAEERPLYLNVNEPSDLSACGWVGSVDSG
jgi:molybdopterin-guanine dinucleotide biosynthesis protein A